MPAAAQLQQCGDFTPSTRKGIPRAAGGDQLETRYICGVDAVGELVSSGTAAM